MNSRSAVDTGPLGALVAWMLAAAVSAQFALFLGGILGDGVWWAWGVGLLVLGWGARLASMIGEERKLVATQIAILVVPVVLIVLGIVGGAVPVATFAGALLGVLAVGWGIAIPVTQWIAGRMPERPDGRPATPPLPGASFAIALFFALPTPRTGAAVAGLAAVAALVLAASLGSVASRSREAGSLTASPALWSKWGATAIGFALIAGLVGFGAAAIANPTSFLGRPSEVPPIPGGSRIEPHPNGSLEGPANVQPNGVGEGSDGGQGSKPPPKPSPSPNGASSSQTPRPEPNPSARKPRERDWREYLWFGLLAVAAVAFLAIARRYGDQILAFLERLAGRLSAPLARYLARWREGREAARLRARAAGLPDPFASPKDARATVARIEASLAALGLARRPEEAISFHLLRAGKVLGGDSERWQSAGRVANRIRFGESAPAGADIRVLSELDAELAGKLGELPDAEVRRQEVRLGYAKPV